MTDFERFAKALALTESNDKQFVWGDDGIACGRWQMHPAWVYRYWPHYIGVDWSWDHLFRAALVRFWGELAGSASITVLAMEFHIGHWVLPSDTAWDEPYAARFKMHWDALGALPAA